MSKTIYVDTNKDTGSDFASGLDQKRPVQSLQKAKEKVKAGDTILVRDDSVFTTPQVLDTNGVQYGRYSIGTEQGTPPSVILGRLYGKDGLEIKQTGVLFDGSDNHLSGWAVDGASIGVDLASSPMNVSRSLKAFYTGNEIVDVSIRRYAWAVRVRANQTTLTRVAASKGRMYRDGDKTATGANAFTLWGDEGVVLRDVVLADCYSEDAWAYSSGLPDKPDGSTVETWGNVENTKVLGLTSVNSGTFCEVGGRKFLNTGKPANEAVRGLVFQDCLILDPMGRALYVNAKTGDKADFPIDIEGVEFLNCRIKADDDKASPFFIGAGHGNLSKKLSVIGCTIVARAQHFNAGAGTDINTIVHDDNIYVRSDGGKNVGVKLTPRETFHSGNSNAEEWLQMARETQAKMRG